MPSCEGQGTYLGVLPMKDASSSYSRGTSFSSNFQGYHWEPKVFNHSLSHPERAFMGSGNDVQSNRKPSPRPQEMHIAQPSETTAPECGRTSMANVQKSKFIEQFGSDRSLSSPALGAGGSIQESLVSPRQMSVGWMSGGRRLGYGYTLVPADEADGRPSHGNLGEPVVGDNKQGTEVVSDSHDKQRTETTSKISLRIGDSTYDISSIIHRLNPRHRSGAATSVEATNQSDTASCDSVTSSLWEKLGYRKKGRNDQETETDKKPPWSHFCGVGLEQTLEEPSISRRDASGNVDGEERGRMGLNHARSIWAKGRSMTELAREVEAKMAISAEQNSIALRNGTRVVKYKIRDLRKRCQKADDDHPIFAVDRKDSFGTSQERASTPDKHIIDREEPEGSGSDDVADNLADTFHEFPEIQPVPE
ncbi:hypothetical protein EYZ11_000672 [Aspergillus tanneri]|nr:hypothetical protein EYZ11_000672 [Aspergillus tanneri]